MKVKQSVERLDQSLKELKLPCRPTKLVDEVKVKVGDVFRKCRFIKDIEDKFTELEYNETGEQIHCVVCKKKFHPSELNDNCLAIKFCHQNSET